MSKLKEYLAGREESLEVFAFFQEEDYLAAQRRESFDLLLFTEGFFGDAKAYRKQKHKILLSEECTAIEGEEFPVFFKYQSADHLLREIHNCLGNMIVKTEERRVFLGQKESIAILSPCGHRMQTPLALAVAEEMASKKKTLYLNFSMFQGFCKNLGIEKRMDLGDLFYQIREEGEEFLKKLPNSVYAIGGFDVIPPPENPEHYMEWSNAEMEVLFRGLFERSGYEAFVFDIQCMLPGFFEVLESCDQVWLLRGLRNRRDVCVEELMELLKRRSPKLCERVREVSIADGMLPQEGRYQIEEFYIGEPGRCAREVLGRGTLVGD